MNIGILIRLGLMLLAVAAASGLAVSLPDSAADVGRMVAVGSGFVGLALALSIAAEPKQEGLVQRDNWQWNDDDGHYGL